MNSDPCHPWRMRKLMLLLPLISLLTSCQFKRSDAEICARWLSKNMSTEIAAEQLDLNVESNHLAVLHYCNELQRY